MYYCLVDFLALLVLVITNHDILLKKAEMGCQVSQKYYRWFLYAVIAYYLSDITWAWLYFLPNLDWLYVDTEVYFIVMAAGILFWLRFVVAYLGIVGITRKLMTYAGLLLLTIVVVCTPLNRLWPIMFWIDADGIYHASIARDIIFVYQVLILLLISTYTLGFSPDNNEKQQKRHITIGLSGLIMMVFIAVQIFFPTYPLYAISYMMGGCLLRTFVIENEREEYRINLEIALEREKEQFQELKRTWELAYKDALTGVKSKLAYVEESERIDREIGLGKSRRLAIAVFDVNNLKVINDTLGHDMGNKYIQEACRIICDTFKKSPVYRVGGDEFVVILERDDYENREGLAKAFNQQIEQNVRNNSVVIAMGMADYVPGKDNSYKRVFGRADMEMYRRKRELKAE